MSAPRKTLKTLGRMELTPASFTLILRQRLERVCGEVLLTFLEEINPGCSTLDMRNWPLFYYYFFKAYT